jgi:uncharacterized protein (DUF427 family)
VLEPSPDHPITITPSRGEVVVTLAGRAIARTTDALILAEGGYRPVFYLPLDDVDASVLRPSDTATYCPYKGDAAYYSVDVGDGRPEVDLIWTYRDPYPAVAEIAGRVAFYAHRVDISAPAVSPDG